MALPHLVRDGENGYLFPPRDVAALADRLERVLRMPHDERQVLIHRATFVESPSIVVVAQAWIVPEHRFHETCLVLPAQDVPSLASIDGPYYKLHFRPDGSREPSRLDPYRVPLKRLAEEISSRL